LKVKDIVYSAIDSLNQDDAAKVKILKDPDFLLLDADSAIDSLTLVNLLVSIESLLEENFSKSFSIVSEDSITSDDRPFQNIGNLIDYLEKLVGGS